MLMLIAFSVGNVWADPAAAGTTLFSENFGGYSANDVPSGSVTTATGRVVYGNGSVTYTCTASGTKIYNENTGGGTAPEILVAKNGGTFVIAGIPSGDAQAITVSWTQNKQSLDVAPTGTGYSGSVSGKPANAGTRSFDITVADGADATFTLTFTGSGTSNVRVDDIVVTVKTAGEGGAPAKTLSSIAVSGTPTKTAYYAGDEFDPAGLTVTGTYSDESTAPITSGITWTYNPSQTLVKDQTSIGVIATVSEIASAEYNVTGLTVTAASPKITITQNEVADFAASYAEYTWTAGGVSGKLYAYKNAGMQFNPSKTGYYVYNTDPIPGRITKITMTKASGTDRSWTPYVSTTAMTSASGTALDAQTVTTSGASWDVTGSNSYFYLTVSGGATVIGSIVIEYTEEAGPAIDAPSISGDVNFVGSTTVTISHEDADHIYYTTNGDAPTTSSAEYTAPFSLTNSATVKAIAVKGSDISEPASKTFTKVEALESLAALLEATVSAETAFNVVISNWVVTGVQGTRAWIADAANEKGILLYKSGHGFVVGNKLNGVVIGTKTKLYQGYPEMTTLVSTDVTVTTAEAITPRVTTIAALTSGHPAEQGTVVKLEGVTYESSALSDGVNSIAADNKLFSSLALVDGTTYDITGVVEYLNEGVVKIMPRSADDVEAQSVVVIPTAANLAALKAAERGTYILTLTNAVVTYVNGNNAFIEDATGGALIYFASHGYSAGDCLNGDYQVVTTDYQGKFEITAMEPQAGAATTTAEIPLTTVSIATLNADFAAYESKRIKIAGANVTDAISGSDRNGAINDGAALAVYAAVASTITLTADDNVDIIGYPGFHNTDQQLNVWAQADITVNEKDPAGIAFDPASATITAGDAWSAPDFANPNSLDVTFSSDDESVATVSNAGVVALAGGYGTAVITAHTDGDATHNAGNATYTVTVNDPASVDTRKVANSPATFTAVSGDLTPNDITYASYQGGSSTAPAIYNDGIRLYQIGGSNDFGGFVTITAKTGCTIDEVQITTTSKYATTVAYSVDGNETLSGSESVAKSGSYTTGTGLNVSSVNILNLGTGSDGRLEIASIKVYYTGEPAAIDHYELGGTYQTAFMQNEEFNHTGLIVYAAYDALGENKVDITSMCTFSDPDMSTTGDKTIEITYNEAVVASYTINVAADSRKVADSPAAFTTVSGDMTPNDITFASNQGGASTAPANYNDGIRLYQAPSADAIGGFITLKAKKGCTIDQVKITTTNTYATTVAYSVDGNENLLGSESVAKSSDYSTPSGLNVESVNIVNKGTGSSGRLEIASIKVWYTGDALPVHHYILGGTYATEFEQYGEFNFEGLTVTAAYDELETITEAVTGFTVEADLSTAGAKKANVMLNSVKIAEYDITVNASAKTDPALAYIPASVILTFGQSLTAPTFSNDHNVSPITYNSDKPAVATVDAEGNIALAGGTGVAVITASFAGDDDYIESEATFTITVNEPAEDLTGPWTLASTVAAGDKIIIGATKDANTYAMGKQNSNNRAAVASTLEGATLTPGAATKVFTLVDAGEGKFAILASNGKYLTSATSGSSNNLLEADNYDLDNAKWTISIDGEGIASVVAAAGSKTVMQYNSGSTIFSCYGSDSQTDINIYKKDVPVKDLVRGELNNGKWGTLCPAQTVEQVEGAVFYQISYLEEKDGLPFNMVFDEIEGTTLTAGKPYFFIANANEIRGYKTGDALDAAGDGVNGFYGWIGENPKELTEWHADYSAAENNTFVIHGNKVVRINQEGTMLPSERCYININSTEPSRVAVPKSSRRRISMSVATKDAAQGFENIESSDAPMKVMIEGTLYIIRGEKVFDATGRLVK